MFTLNRSLGKDKKESGNYSGTLCDRLKQRYENFQQDWQSLFNIQENNFQDFEFIQYIVNFIIELAKHNIVISELPDIIRILHCEADAILRKNPMITLEEAIDQVQTAGAIKYPYLKKVKPISTEDFIKEVLRQVFDRLGTIITLNMIENICRFTTCSAKQLLHTMPAIDVHEAATLIIEDISRNQREINKNQKQTDAMEKTISHSTLSTRAMNRKLEGTPASNKKERIRSERELSRSTQNSKQLLSKTKLFEHNDLPISSSSTHRSSKNINKNQQSRSSNQINSSEQRLSKTKKSHNDFIRPIMENTFGTMRQHKSTNVLSSNSVQEQTKNQKVEIRNPLTASMCYYNNLVNQEKTQNINLANCKSNTQTYSIHSEEGLPAHARKPTANLVSIMNDKPIKSLNKISQKTVKQISSQIAPFTNITPFTNEVFCLKDHPFITEAMPCSDPKEIKYHSKTLQSIRHYSRYNYQHSDLSNNVEQINEIDSEKCPLEDILNHQFI